MKAVHAAEDTIREAHKITANPADHEADYILWYATIDDDVRAARSTLRSMSQIGVIPDERYQRAKQSAAEVLKGSRS